MFREKVSEISVKIRHFDSSATIKAKYRKKRPKNYPVAFPLEVSIWKMLCRITEEVEEIIADVEQ